jgi:hypothetical protein
MAAHTRAATHSINVHPSKRFRRKMAKASSLLHPRIAGKK